MIRKLLLLLLLIALGIAGGMGLALADFGRWPLGGDALVHASAPAEGRFELSVEQPMPRALVQSTEYDFGKMERDTTLSHDFLIANGGDAPLQLTKGDTSCHCTLSGLDTEELAPGKTGNVTMTWTAQTPLNEFRHTAKIHTNDPRSPVIEFAIHGAIVSNIDVHPQILTCDKVSDETWSANIAISTRTVDDFRLLGYEVEDADAAEYFDVDFQQQSPADDDIKSQWSAKVTVKPGLPLGRIHQKILLNTNYPSKPQLEIKITGAVQGNLKVLGDRWNENNQALSLGALDRQAGGSGQLKVFVRGPHREAVRLSVKQRVPEFLEVQIGEPIPLAGGARLQIPVTVTVPPGAPTSSYLGDPASGYGEVTFETEHPDEPELKVRVSFAVSR